MIFIVFQKNVIFAFSSSLSHTLTPKNELSLKMEALPIVDISEYLNGTVRQEDIDMVRKSFVETSCLIRRYPSLSS